jgi:hypothetical protein
LEADQLVQKAKASKFRNGGEVPQVGLNYMALERTLKEVEKRGIQSKLDDTYELVLEGWDVYEHRWSILTFISMAVAVWLLFRVHSIRVHLVCAILSFVWYDFFSGVLHVVLDEPSNLRGWRSRLVAKPCLEFQWHHIIPTDIAQKSYLQVCGDLNAIAFPVVFLYLSPSLYNALASDVVTALAAYKIIFAYYGQASHRLSHRSGNESIVSMLQNVQFFLSVDTHRGHHRHHNDNFCIGNGWCNPLIRFMRSVTLDPTCWMVLLGSLICFDVAILTRVAHILV